MIAIVDMKFDLNYVFVNYFFSKEKKREIFPA
jgi:hypothetical protein